ncbi:NifB/NifX family molybdenum-iron cluster-binding protein [Desulfotomaculum copahuensis]|uniref:Dinitrogenase iron-molybdenum cofactor biosynthesis domain-containing protein n=1 Tax=Desulfotomaculum copahuensis TaxID=1838280 RepID=A0A1B7LB35_9FIRM|nr:NifB/NifX family molybdenum-iron cluster-binding protein [Desulfotomaculum copahuensis]OAT79539.1 hypothetical protein A6M21_15705 [Desulfotomaculum copahuensis]
MNVAVISWNSLISPLFEGAQKALVFRVGAGQVVFSREINLDCPYPLQKMERLCEAGVRTVICGGISDISCRQLSGMGIQVISWVTGSVDEVLDAYIKGRLNREKFAMPGIWRRRCRFRKGCR